MIQYFQAQSNQVLGAVLLYTADTHQNAIDTRIWLADQSSDLEFDAIDLIPVDDELSDDPVNLVLAVKAARRGLELAQMKASSSDILEFNASSGTPVMKSAWGVLKAAGYTARRDRLWQVRNPKEMKPGQAHVFEMNIAVLRDEFDLKLIQQQIADYNYSGALIEVQNTAFATPEITGLLAYARCRRAFDFNRANDAILGFKGSLDDRWFKGIAKLRTNDEPSLFAEVYFNMVLSHQNQDYFSFLARLSSLKEVILKRLIEKHIAPIPEDKSEEQEPFWQALKGYDGGRIYRSLEEAANRSPSIRLQGWLNQSTMIEILGCLPEYAKILNYLKAIDQECKLRNKAIHQLRGVSSLNQPEEILTKVRRILKPLVKRSLSDNPFDDLNEEITSRMSKIRSSG